MKVATESTTGKFKRAIETIKADLLPLGQKIMEVATTLMNFGNSIANFFSKLPGPIKSGLGILLSLGVISGPIIMVTGLLVRLYKWPHLMHSSGTSASSGFSMRRMSILHSGQ